MSYMYNPSKKVTELLSKFLEFDPEQLELGIWSGDLSLRNVNLKADAIHPLLNKGKMNTPAGSDPSVQDPLHLKLVSGTVGQMRIKIPWKRLVWGKGAVQVEISDVMIVLALESREETERKQKQRKPKKGSSTEHQVDATEGVSQAYREAKQRRLREAERRHLQGLPVALWLDSVHRKNSIKKDAAKAEEAETKVKEPKGNRRLDRWMKNTSTDIFWRFYTGLHGSIKKARIVVVQDGVEVGCIVHSIDVVAGKEELKVNVQMGEDSDSEDPHRSDMTPPPDFVYKSAHEDGEHVDKVIKQEGVGVFIRKEASMAKVPQQLRFSTSVSADDYILRPVNLDLSFSFFYPHPPERRKKKAADSASPATTASTVSVAESISQTSSNKRRRGKRDRIAAPSISGTETTAASTNDRFGPVFAGEFGVAALNDTSTPLPGERKPASRTYRRKGTPTGGRLGTLADRRTRRGSLHSQRSGSHSIGVRAIDELSMGMTEMQPVIAEKSSEPFPRFDCSIVFEDIQIVFSTRHYELLNYFLSTTARMKNGRPDKAIRAVRNTDAGSLHRKIMEIKEPTPAALQPASTLTAAKDRVVSLLAPLAAFRSVATEPKVAKPSAQQENMLRQNLARKVGMRSSRQEIIVKWWDYAIGVVLFEVGKRKTLTTMFRKMYISFDWNRQKYKRKDYIDLYISTRLENRSHDEGAWIFEEDDREERLLKIEDELPLEQILLYRTIAKLLRGRGLSKMPASILGLPKNQGVKIVRRAHRQNRRSSLATHQTDRSPMQGAIQGATTLLSMIQDKFDFAQQLRQGGVGRVPKVGSNDNLEGKHVNSSDPHTAEEGEMSSMDYVRSTPSGIHPENQVIPSTTPSVAEGRPPRKKSAYGDNNSTGDMDGGGRHRPGGRVSRKRSIGFETSDVQAGNFYASAGKNRDASAADGRTLKMSVAKGSRSVKYGAASDGDASTVVEDTAMRITFSLQVKSIDLMIVQEEFFFDIGAQEIKANVPPGRISPNGLMRETYAGDNSSSGDDVSDDMSVLTDDQRFFNEEGAVSPVAEEEAEDEVRLSSSDFLLFGLPDNLLLRMSIAPLTASFRAKSGGPKHIGLSIGRIRAVGENDNLLLSIGPEQLIETTPVSEVSLEASIHRVSKNQSTGVDSSVHRIKRNKDLHRKGSFTGFKSSVHGSRIPGTSSLSNGRAPSRAVSVSCVLSGESKILQCDLSKIAATLDFDPMAKLLRFYTKTRIKFPESLIAKSSREVARKYLVHKTTATSNFGQLSTAFRIHGLEVTVPFVGSDAASTEASSLMSSTSDNPMSTNQSIGHCNLAILSVDTVELYSGEAVDEMCASGEPDCGVSRNSLQSGFFTGKNRGAPKVLEMIDVVELKSSHDSFSSNHWVATMSGIDCVLGAKDGVNLTEIPIDVEVLVTVNTTSLLETESPKQQAVVEISPVQLVLSKKRLELLSGALSNLDFSTFDKAPVVQKRRRKPDPPRIEILSRRVLHSIDLSCRRVKVAMVQDTEPAERVTLKVKEVIMEECLSDFLSVVSCFDFSLPNEEALSSAMQICIGRLVGLGLSDDEAWGCTNAARLNFLDDVALMRRSQADVLMGIQLSGSKRNRERQYFTSPVVEEEEGSQENSESFDNVDESLANSNRVEDEDSGESESTEPTEDDSDDDTADSVDIVETTLSNAVEKTVATFAQLLREDHPDDKHANSILVLELPLGVSLSTVKLFYDTHLTSSIPSLVLTNSAGIELLTIVPSSSGSTGSASGGQEEATGHGIVFSRFDLDKDYGFGSGGLPMSLLGSDAGSADDRRYRERTRLDDVDLGEVELLFSSRLYETIVDELSELGNSKKGGDDSFVSDQESDDSAAGRPPSAETSSVTIASCVSILLTSDEMVPFSRITLEEFAFKNKKASSYAPTEDSPSWIVIADSCTLNNLSPEGQFYSDTVSLLSPTEGTELPFQLRYFASPDPWKHSSRLELDFRGMRVLLIRQYLYELLHFLVYERYGVGRLKKKYSKDVRDVNGNQKPPLLYSVNFFDSSVICPRCSSSSDMIAFEVEKVSIAVSYILESFAMPTESSPFEASPVPHGSDTTKAKEFGAANARTSSFISVSEYESCMGSSGEDSGRLSSPPISSFDKDLKKRLTISIEQLRVFSAMSPDKETKEIIESPLFRFFHEIDGRAEAGKSVYRRCQNVGSQPSDICEQYWEEMSTTFLNLEVLADYAPHLRLLISDRHGPFPFFLDARLSQLCLLLSVWYSNMQELPAMFPFVTSQVEESAKPPIIPKDFPAYGTEEFVSLLEDLSATKSEICCIFHVLKLRCTFDPPGRFPMDPECFQYFSDPYCSDKEKPGIVITISDAIVHVIGDPLNIKRIGVGASTFDLVDERQSEIFQRVLSTRPNVLSPRRNGGSPDQPPAWADVGWGLRNDIHTLNSSLPLPFQVTVFMTPGWSLINVGAECLDAIMFELSWIWVFLGFFKNYFTEAAFGNPGHEAERWAHKLKNSLRKSYGQQPVKFVPPPGINVDFRLWLRHPILCIPSDYDDLHVPCLQIESKTGLWYRYKSMQTFSSQEVATTDIDLCFLNEFQSPRSCRRSDVTDSLSGIRPLIEGLSFGLRYDCNNAVNHKDITVRIPLVGSKTPSCSVTGRELEVEPIIMPAPLVCIPFERLSRSLGPKVCEITCIIEVLPITSSTMANFFKGPAEINEEFAPEEIDQGPATFSVSAGIGDLRIFAIDPVLGVQLPIAVMSISSLALTASKFAEEPTSLNFRRGESLPEDLQVTVDCHLWGDYFKLGITRSWEPFLEPFKCLLLYEKSKGRGQGISLDADSPFHLNLTGALLQNLGEIFDSFSRVIAETFGEQSRSSMRLGRSLPKASPSKDRVGAIVEDSVNTVAGQEVTIWHEIPKPLKSDDRVAFSLRNLTGQKIRIHQQSDHFGESRNKRPAVVTYLNQVESMGLTFAATISVIKNLSIVEVPYPGLPNSRSGSWSRGSLQHAVDVQVPGFKWLHGIKVDTFGRKFESLAPRSADVLAKIFRDWRLKNAMMLLTEVGLESGGRLVTIRSIFEIRNNTTHSIKIVFNPDPRHQPDTGNPEEGVGSIADMNHCDEEKSRMKHLAAAEEIEVVEPGDVFQIPTLLLERALQVAGSHLGCLWLCPDIQDDSSSFLQSFRTEADKKDGIGLQVGFSSRPVQLAKLVHESALIFQNGNGEDISVDKAKSGVQVSCPTHGRDDDGHAPFCYAIEVGRSPVVSASRDISPADMTKEAQQASVPTTDKKQANVSVAEKKGKKQERIHAPVAYTLSVHAPLIIVNLLPEGGRFELMHAVRRTVLWYADLQPGQQIPVHSVGLDAPLLLLVNLGFCRTPVGEGALVHHGADAPPSAKEQARGIKSIGKVVTKGTKQIGKTLTTMSDSPNKRGQGRLNQIQNPQFQKNEARKEKKKATKTVTGSSLGLDTGVGGIESVDGKVHSWEGITYSQSDVASDTTVVDGVGQRLTLNIENVRGGGGQRRVSLFCPFWIVNTTEHALRYKQEKGKSFVSGNVLSPKKDGSRPVDGSNRNYRDRYKLQASRRQTNEDSSSGSQKPMNSRTIFSGTPGALATAPGRCDLPASDLAQLIDKDVTLEKLAGLSFMFNFHEDVLSIGHQMLSVQLYDGTGQSKYVSDWSRGFSLESVGFSQIVGMHCKEGRTLELSVAVNVAPGFLSGYTKIVRFLPRYVIFNRLDRPIRLWQDSSIFRSVSEDRAAASEETESNKEMREWRYNYEEKHHRDKINQYESLYGRPATLDERPIPTIPEGTTAHRSALYITTAAPTELIPFHLPDSRGERQLRIDLGGTWNVTASIASDFPGEHTLKISRAIDLRLLNHVSTRSAPKYKLVLPPPDVAGIGMWDGELGVYFETDWGGDRRIIVKGTQRGKYAFNHTDIHVGDELLRIDGVSVFRMTFAEAMKLLKERLAYVSMVKNQEQNATEQQSGRRGLRRLSLTMNIRRQSHSYGKEANNEDPTLSKSPQLTLTFRTLEERLRKLRLKAGRDNWSPSPQEGTLARGAERMASQKSLQRGTEKPASQKSQIRSPTKSRETTTTQMGDINVEMKSLHNTMFVILRNQNVENPPFRIQNRSIHYIVFFRQRGCDGHPWNYVKPGESLPYSWEEPMKTKKLTVRVAASSQDVFKIDCQNSSHSGSLSNLDLLDLNPESDVNVSTTDQEKRRARTARLRQSLAYQFVDTEERGGFGPSITVRLEEIGYRNFLPVPSKDVARSQRVRRNHLNCEVDTDGGTRLLVVSDDTGSEDERSMLTRHLETLRKQISYEQERTSDLHSLQDLLSKLKDLDATRARNQSNPDDSLLSERKLAPEEGREERKNAVEADAKGLMEDYPEETTITCRHQIVIQVLEAVGLNPSDFVGSCNPYCELILKGRSKSRKHFFQKRRNKRKTCYIERSLEPKWTDQTFVFDVPEEAISVTRGHSIQVKVRNFRHIGQHPILGQAAVHFGSVRDQAELEGWYPLAGRTGRRDVETAPSSDWGRGSVKLRVHWVYTVPALLDYFVLISERRLVQLTKSRRGMQDQLAHAIESDERKREARGQLASGHIQKLGKFQKQKQQKQQRQRQHQKGQSSHSLMATVENSTKHVVGTLNKGLNSSVSALKGTLKTSRDRYLYALYFQTAESKRKRQMEEQEEKQGLTANDESIGSMNLNALSLIPEQKSQASGSGGSLTSSKPSLEAAFAQEQSMPRRAPPSPEREAKGKRTLGDFFSQQNTGEPEAPPQATSGGISPQVTSESPSPRGLNRFGNRRALDPESGRRLSSQRRLSLDIDEALAEETSVDMWEESIRQGQAIYDGLYKYNQAADINISDLISVSTDAHDEVNRKRTMLRLLSEGFVFHESGTFFHEDHLPHHFRRSLFASSMGDRRSGLLYRPKLAVGSSSSIRHFKSWQSAQALYNDLELDVLRNEKSFIIRLKDKTPKPAEPATDIPASKMIIAEKLTPPKIAPVITLERAKVQIDSVVLSRNQFERACKRTLSSVLNPGGWLTIRPITALNLPDTYTGMHVKLRYGSEVLVSETVDAKVTPRWAPADFLDGEAAGSAKKGGPRKSTSGPTANGNFRFIENDLHVHVEPQQTSGSIKVSVVAERLNTKLELGVLHIPLGAAIAACIDSTEEGLDANEYTPPMYVRWFPLMSPRVAIPAEGDMGLSSRPNENEKLRDNMFQQYFAPCIQLALIWWPNSNEKSVMNEKSEKGSYSDDGDESDRVSDRLSATLAVRGPSGSTQMTDTPAMETYFNADIGRISAALIDSQRAVELLSFSALDIDVRYSVTKTKTRVGLVVGWIQLDHQDNRAREPVVLAPTPAEHMQPTLQILAVKDNLRSKSNIVSYEYIGVALQEMDLTVEESWIFELWDFFTAIMRKQKAKKMSAKGQRRADALSANENCFAVSDVEESTAPSLFSMLEGTGDGDSPSAKTKIYVEQLILGLVKVNLSYIKGKKQSWELADEGARARGLKKHMQVKEIPNLALATAGAVISNTVSRVDQSEVFFRWSQHTYDEDLMAENGGTMSYNLPGLIAAVFPSVSDAPIRLQGKAIDHVFESPGEIMSSIKNFYVNETLKQVYKIIGSLDFVGNPTILFSSFVTGVRDLVVAPTSAFLKSPTNVNQVGIGVAKGAISLFSHSASGIFGFSAKMSATAGQAVAILSLDAEFRQWHRDRVVTEAANLNRVWKRRGVQSVSEMVTRPVGDILLGVAMGATGFFTSPYKGLRKGGGLGLLQGVAVGTAGVIAKPLVGFLDAFTHFSATAHDIAKSVNVLERRYQPALKLRLPYIFGPMNVLAAFDPDAARSVYLLKIFPPKAKRTNLKRGDSARWKEIHVASVVLYMEPGVETYAIATTIRVVLIKLKKESGGSLAPTFCWEVDLTGRAVVSSRVSDHGHNGVALTITKCAQDGKAEVAFASPDAKGKQNSPETTQGDNDNVQTANISSARSVDSGYVPEEEVISEVAGETTKSEYFDSENPRTTVVETLPGGELENSYHEHGATEKGGEVLEWFTVLAEYQHRRQLTHLHNAISCIVGDFNAVIVDRGRAHEQNTEGSTLFGMFGFEDGITDGKAAHTANYELVAALESLPWMHEDVFKICKGRPRSQQRETVAKLRQNWVFSRDLEASMAQAGPAWLIETRARAMFVSGAAPPVPQFLDPEDPVVKEVLSQLEQGNISSEQANRLMLSRNELCSDETSHHEGIVSVSSKDVDRLVETTRRANSSDHAQYGEIPGQRASSGGQRSHTSSLGASIGSRSGMDERRPLSRGVSEDKTAQVQKDRLSSRLEISNEIFHSTRMESIRPPLFVEQEPEYTGTLSEERRSTGTVEARDSAIDGPIGSATSGQQTTIGDSDLPHFKYPVAAEKRKLFHEGSTPVDGSEALESTAARQHQATKINNASFDTPVSGPLNPSPDSRMDKMESILEQLVILNATQAQIKTIPTDITSDVHSVTSESKAANAIRSELDDLRAQAQARMKEDEALKNEIATLRQQLAERRNNSTPVKASTKERARTPTKEWNRKVMKVPEIFRNVAKHGSRKQDDDTKETSDVPKETSNGAGAIPNGRYVASGTSSKESENEGVISLKSGSPEQGRAYRKSNEGEMPRRSSGDSMEYELNQMQRRNSTAGTERQERIMQRRLSGDASN